jgi:Acyl-CoA dehydrogenase, middle domain
MSGPCNVFVVPFTGSLQVFMLFEPLLLVDWESFPPGQEGTWAIPAWLSFPALVPFLQTNHDGPQAFRELASHPSKSFNDGIVSHLFSHQGSCVLQECRVIQQWYFLQFFSHSSGLCVLQDCGIDDALQGCLLQARVGGCVDDLPRVRVCRQGNEYIINGLKWWTSGAMDPRCKICIFMGKTDPEAAIHKQQSMILVPMDTPGVRIVRPLDVFGYDDAPHGHAEVSFTVRTPTLSRSISAAPQQHFSPQTLLGFPLMPLVFMDAASHVLTLVWNPVWTQVLAWFCAH